MPYCLGGICGPALQSVITGNVSKQEQGELQGALTSLMSATAIIGPPLMTNLFLLHARSGSFPVSGSTVFLAFIMLGMGTVIAYFNFKRNKIAEIKLKTARLRISFVILIHGT